MTVSRSAGLGVALAVPFAFVLTHLLLRIEPPLGAAIRAAEDSAPYVGEAIVLSVLVLCLTGLAITAAPLIGQVRSGAGIAGAHDKLAVSLVIVALIATFAGAFVVDQLPCWQGVPNCD